MADRVIYVHAVATGAADGTTWTDAYPDLQDALDDAKTVGECPCDIWVAAGTYVPESDGASPRGGKFSVPPDVKLFGGFRGMESRRDARDPSIYATILSGDVSGDDGPDFAHHEENVYVVVELLGAGIDDPGGIFDGFTITGGTGNGMRVLGAWTIQNCRFVANSEDIFTTGVRTLTGWGGGAVLVLSSTHPTFLDCVFEGNRASTEGGAMMAWTATRVIRCRFVNNQAEQYGGGAKISNMSSDALAEFRDCVFENNRSGYGAAGMSLGSEHALVSGCLFRDNHAEHGYGGGLSVGGQNVEVTRSVFLGNRAEAAGGLYASGWATVVLTNSLIVANEAKYFGGGVIEDTLAYFAGNTVAFNTTVSEGPAFDWPWDAVSNAVRNNLIWGNMRAAPSEPSDVLAAQVWPETVDKFRFRSLKAGRPRPAVRSTAVTTRCSSTRPVQTA